MRLWPQALAFIWIIPVTQAQPAVPARETLHYSVEWRMIEAGRIRVNLHPAEVRGEQGREVDLRLQSVGLVSRMYRVDNQYRVSLAGEYCAADVFAVSHEGRRHRETRITFDPVERKASYHEQDLAKNTVVLQKEISTPPCTHDVIGGLFALREKRIELGQSIQMPVSDGKKSVMARVEAQERETIRTKAGTFRTVRYEAYLFNGVLYGRKGRLQIWITDDDRRLPVQFRFRLGFTVGTLTIELTKEEHS
jgi:hypothetical protein